MWTLSFVLDLAVLFCAVSSSPPSPINVVFSSVNLRNVLQWTPGNGTPEDTHFTVQYAIYGDTIQGSKGKRVHWRPAQQCMEIARSWCDLSFETWDEEEGYYAKVRAVGKRESSKWAMTRRFDPKLDTILGPPLVSVEMEGDNAIIVMKVPSRYQPSHQSPVVSMATVYPQLTYNLSIQTYGQTYYFPVDSSPYTYQLMHHNKKYCFSARMRLLSMPIQCQSSAWHCITTPQDPEIVHLHKVVWAIVVPTLCMCILAVVAYFLHNYLMGKGQKSHILTSPTFRPTSLTFSPENLSLNLILVSVINNESPSDADRTISDPECHKEKTTHPLLPYSPQRPETPAEPDDLTVDYGCVGVAPQTCVRGEETAREKRHDGDEDGNNLNGKHQICVAGDSYKKKEWGVEDGHFTRVYTAQSNSYLSQKSPYACNQNHSPVHSQTQAQTEMSTLVQAQPWSQLMTQFQGGTNIAVDREQDDIGCSGLFLSQIPQIGLFHLPLNLQTNKEVGVEGELDRKVRVETNGKTDGDAGERSESETLALLSAYASQNIRDNCTIHPDQSDPLTDDYGLLRVASAHSIEKEGEEDDDDDDDEEGLCINWDPETRKLVFPEMVKKFYTEGDFDEGMQRADGSEGSLGRGEVNELKLENVLVKQASEEEEEVLREMERGGETGWQVDDIFTKWNLVMSMDQ